MNKEYSVNPIGFLSFFSFLGAGIIFFFYKIGNINLAICVVAMILLIILGVISALTVYKGKDNPALRNILRLILIAFSIILILFIVGVISLGFALS
ncbi:MAG TPA: hypothetical protein VFW77_00955 [Candidatus Saccharimonadales bacterium]|nr:hypothetical protein [Candidatus Saccharimonadales bacterium]